MKKVIILLFLLLLAVSCDNKNSLIGVKVGDIRTTETEHYIYIERCTGVSAANIAFWEFDKIVSKDSIKEENILDALEP